MSDYENLGLETLAVRAGQQRTQEGEHSEPIFTTSSYVFANAAEAAARFSGKEPGNVYSRFTNPTVRTFEQRLAALEGGERCVATASGMAAILSVAMSLLKAGDHILTSSNLFGSTVLLYFLRKALVTVTFLKVSNQILGGVVATAKSLFIILVLVLLAGFTGLPQRTWWKESLSAPYFVVAAEWSRQFLYGDIARHIRYR